ncbi:MAG: enoyl-CoA hydratase/isomerase family protein [Bdellovibrio sp.]|nr:MAG: enoyl-CoA hydratase/isomerase family protein [Bdellovibrio sp.]
MRHNIFTVLEILIKRNFLHLCLKNLETANSFSLEEAQQLDQALQLDSSSFKGVLFYSEGSRYFCSGGNLKKYAYMQKEEGLRVNDQIACVLEKLSQYPYPTCCVIEGDCYGGGMELISAFDYRISAPHSFLGFWQRKVGLSFGWGGEQRWKRLIPEGLLSRLYLEASHVSAYEAADLGLVDEVCSTSLLFQRAYSWLERASSYFLDPLRDFKKQPKDEKSLFEKLWLGKAHRKALSPYKKQDN